MITLWIKIMYYKINKALSPRNADTGTEPRVGARVMRTLQPVSQETVMDLYRKGLVYAPTEDRTRDMLRLEQLEEDRRARELQEMESGTGCPCGGRHFPEPDACRWCRCHDPRSVHHGAPAVGIMQVIQPPETIRLDLDVPPYPVTDDQIRETLMAVRPSAEIELCLRCGHPQHPLGDRRCAFLDRPGLSLCPCTGPEDEAALDPHSEDGHA